MHKTVKQSYTSVDRPMSDLQFFTSVDRPMPHRQSMSIPDTANLIYIFSEDMGRSTDALNS